MIPEELVNKIVMMQRPSYDYLSELLYFTHSTFRYMDHWHGYKNKDKYDDFSKYIFHILYLKDNYY